MKKSLSIVPSAAFTTNASRSANSSKESYREVSSDRAAYVPDSALEKYKGEDFVFVDKGNGRFEKRAVELGERTADGYLVRKGVAPGEHIVTAGALTLKSELYKNQGGD